MIILNPKSGLFNRLQAIDSSLALARNDETFAEAAEGFDGEVGAFIGG